MHEEVQAALLGQNPAEQALNAAQARLMDNRVAPVDPRSPDCIRPTIVTTNEGESCG